MTDETTRRTVLGGMAASAGLMSMIDTTNAQAQVNAKTFVLVHGAWHGGWCWRRVSDLLEKKGHKVFTPTLTGLGETVSTRNSERNQVGKLMSCPAATTL